MVILQPVFKGYQRTAIPDNVLFELEKQKGLVKEKWKCEEKKEGEECEKTEDGKRSLTMNVKYTLVSRGYHHDSVILKTLIVSNEWFSGWNFKFQTFCCET